MHTLPSVSESQHSRSPHSVAIRALKTRREGGLKTAPRVGAERVLPPYAERLCLPPMLATHAPPSSLVEICACADDA